ncbi:MAG: GNAT family N-acetyltransferase [Flavobacteriales bacterium CG_4_9_14_3_um_filter_40_17]|nr:MAG: GNAT family N-acetyltransferase [Flavobacteriales bacterium CG_4_9_14_3_um_filter_40_17]
MQKSDSFLVIQAAECDIKTIKELAYRIWPSTFKDILSLEQIAYMLDMMYSEESLSKQMSKFRHRFFFLKEEKTAVGFMSVEFDYQSSKKTKIHKIYVLPEKQGLGLGTKLINFAAEQAILNNNSSLILNVNKFNKATHFYEKIGFELVKEEKIPIGNDFFMDDFVLEKKL